MSIKHSVCCLFLVDDVNVHILAVNLACMLEHGRLKCLLVRDRMDVLGSHSSS